MRTCFHSLYSFNCIFVITLLSDIKLKFLFHRDSAPDFCVHVFFLSICGRILERKREKRISNYTIFINLIHVHLMRFGFDRRLSRMTITTEDGYRQKAREKK